MKAQDVSLVIGVSVVLGAAGGFAAGYARPGSQGTQGVAGPAGPVCSRWEYNLNNDYSTGTSTATGEYCTAWQVGLPTPTP
jgi:hypothetical protein